MTINELQTVFNVANEGNSKKSFAYWQKHNQQIKFHTFVSIIVACSLGGILAFFSWLAVIMIICGVFVLFSFIINDSSFWIASRQKSTRKRSEAYRQASSRYFMYPYVLYAITLLLSFKILF